jgi:membrane-associated phospholipid phosphatase
MTNVRRWRWWYLSIALVAIGVVVSFYFDATVQSWIAAHPNGTFNAAMENVSRFGDWPEHVALGLILMALAYWRGSRRWFRIFTAMLVACALAGVLARVVKVGAGRARPWVHSEAAWSGPNLRANYHAFPSGHTAASAGFFGMLAFRRWRIGIPLLAIPAVIAFSRMYVEAHFLSDVVCAFVLGLACAWFVARWTPRAPVIETRPR